MMLDLDSEKIMVIGMFVLNLQQCIIINSLFFDKKQKIQLILLSFLILVGAVFELVGVSATQKFRRTIVR